MKVVSSLKSLKKRDLNNKLVKRKGKLYVINKKSETENEEMVHEEVAFVPMLPGVSNGEV